MFKSNNKYIQCTNKNKKCNLLFLQDIFNAKHSFLPYNQQK